MSTLKDLNPQYDYGEAAHGVIIYCLRLLRDRCLYLDSGKINYEKIDEALTGLFSKRFDPRLSLYNQYDESYYILGRYGEEDPADGSDPKTINAVLPFDVGDKFIVLVESSEWCYWEDDIPFAFPVVAYSRNELKAWFAWSIKQLIYAFPESTDQLMEILECHLDVEDATELMRRKLEGEPWAYGPARKREPKMLLWHQLTADKKINDWIRRWL